VVVSQAGLVELFLVQSVMSVGRKQRRFLVGLRDSVKNWLSGSSTVWTPTKISLK